MDHLVWVQTLVPFGTALVPVEEYMESGLVLQLVQVEQTGMLRSALALGSSLALYLHLL